VGRYWHTIQRFLQGKRREDLAAAPPSDGVEAAVLWQAVRRLPPVAQEIIYLRYFLELSVEETAETLQIAPGTVKSRAYRSLQKLRAIIDKEYPELADDRTIS
jgi:RNA polymerase sigma-70 factor (ECF subfamily)